ncbi:hypothetical protein FB45DRAFT_1113012 [Roridomyces roridus]|uniref:Uncharacterized protein n=1 Tax=Roridomyces roridus TaxID=1738132 RepID=A0AAD7B8S9_9AGAR|nr:hypothetical protein FB45DRAFT_1113012 [Roridomyces roridus]
MLPLGGSSEYRLPAGAIAGIVLGVTSLLCVGALLLFLMARRARRRGYGTSFISDSITPVGQHEELTPRYEETKLRREYLENELRAAQERIAHIQSEQHLWANSPGSLMTRSGAESQTETDTVPRLREQNAIQEARIRELEAQHFCISAVDIKWVPTRAVKRNMRQQRHSFPPLTPRHHARYTPPSIIDVSRLSAFSVSPVSKASVLARHELRMDPRPSTSQCVQLMTLGAAFMPFSMLAH